MSDVTTDTMMHSVAAGIAVDIAEEGFDRVSAILSGIPGGANRAVGSALARAAAAGGGQLNVQPAIIAARRAFASSGGVSACGVEHFVQLLGHGISLGYAS